MNSTGKIVPIVLALETSTAAGGAAVAAADVILAERYQFSNKTHSERLLNAVKGALADAQLDLSEVDALAVTEGPGAFTAVRIGMSTAKGICLASGKPLVTISTLEALAAGVGEVEIDICAMLDARKEQVYAGVFKSGPGYRLETIVEPQASRPEDFISSIREKTLFVGDGALKFRHLISETLGEKAVMAPSHLCYPRAGVTALIGVNLFKEGELKDPAAVAPLYFRPSDAEINLKRRMEAEARKKVAKTESEDA